MPDVKPKLSVAEFATKIKTKYPQYKDLDDTVLAEKVIAKYPVYADQVDFKKKVGTEPSSASKQADMATILAPQKQQADWSDSMYVSQNGGQDSKSGAPTSQDTKGFEWSTSEQPTELKSGNYATNAPTQSTPEAPKPQGIAGKLYNDAFDDVPYQWSTGEQPTEIAKDKLSGITETPSKDYDPNAPDVPQPEANYFTEALQGVTGMVGQTVKLADMITNVDKYIGLSPDSHLLSPEEKQGLLYKVGDDMEAMFDYATPEQKQEFGFKLAQTVGQVAGFTLGGWLSGAGKTIALPFMGAAANGISEYEAALDAGASQEDANKALLASLAFGTAESLPILNILNRFDKFTGGTTTRSFANKLKPYIGEKASNVSAETLQGWVEESVQESAVTMAQNIVAMKTYDEARDLFDGVGDSFILGGISGGMFSAAASTFREVANNPNASPEERQKAEAAAIQLEKRAIEVDPEKSGYTTGTQVGDYKVSGNDGKGNYNIVDAQGNESKGQSKDFLDALKTSQEKRNEPNVEEQVKEIKEEIKDLEKQRGDKYWEAEPTHSQLAKATPEAKQSIKEKEAKKKDKIDSQIEKLEEKIDQLNESRISSQPPVDNLSQDIKNKDLGSQEVIAPSPKPLYKDVEKELAAAKKTGDIVSPVSTSYKPYQNVEVIDGVIIGHDARNRGTYAYWQDGQWNLVDNPTHQIGALPSERIYKPKEQLEFVVNKAKQELNINEQKTQEDTNKDNSLEAKKANIESIAEWISDNRDKLGEVDRWGNVKDFLTEKQNKGFYESNDDWDTYVAKLYLNGKLTKEDANKIKQHQTQNENIQKENQEEANVLTPQAVSKDNFKNLNVGDTVLQKTKDGFTEKRIVKNHGTHVEVEGAYLYPEGSAPNADYVAYQSVQKTAPVQGTKTEEKIEQPSQKENITLQQDENELEQLLPNTLSSDEKQGVLRGGEANAAATAIVGAIQKANDAAKERGEGLSQRALKEQEAQQLADYARSNNLWIEDNFGEAHANGVEQDVYLNPDGLTVTKVNPNATHDSWNELFTRIALHNTLFPDTAYTLKGFTERDGQTHAVFEQPLIKKGNTRVTFKDVKNTLGKMGFKPFAENSDDVVLKYTFVNDATGVVISDVHGENVIKDVFGQIHFIDPIVEKQLPIQKTAPVQETLNKENIEQPPTASEAQVAPPNAPPAPPTQEQQQPKESGKDKALLNRLLDSDLSEETKEGIRSKGLTYKPSSQVEANKVSDAIINELGIEQAFVNAEANRYGGDVNSLVMANVINQVYAQEKKSTDPNKRLSFAKQQADFADRYDQWAREAGRGISAIQYFYRTSPAAIAHRVQKLFRATVDEGLESHEKDIKQSYEEFSKQFLESEQFKKAVDEAVEKRLQQEKETVKERKQRRAAQKKKINDLRDQLKIKPDKGTLQASFFLADKVWNLAVDIVFDAVIAGKTIAEAIADGVRYINSQTNTWDESGFRKDLESRLLNLDGGGINIPLTQQEKMLRSLANTAKRLSGNQRRRFLGKIVTQLHQNGGFDFQTFRDMYAEALGLQVFDKATDQHIRSLAETVSNAEDAKQQLIDSTNQLEGLQGDEKVTAQERVVEAEKQYEKAEKEARKANEELSDFFRTPRGAWGTWNVLMQLNTLGTKSLLGNPLGNLIFHAGLLLPKELVKTTFSIVSNQAAAMRGQSQAMTFPQMVAFYKAPFLGYGKGGARGVRVASGELITGIHERDYFERSNTNPIHPLKSLKTLKSAIKGDRRLSKSEWAQNILEASPGGWAAEGIARMLNFGDKPFRNAYEYMEAYRIGVLKGLKGKALELFIRFPDEQSQQKIIEAGERAVFQQQNKISEMIDKAKRSNTIGGKAVSTAVALSVPYVRTPVNMFVEFVDYAFPQISLIKATDALYVKKDSEQAADYLAKAVVGTTIMLVIGKLMEAGLIAGDDDQDDPRARAGKEVFRKPNTVNLSGLRRWTKGGDPSYRAGEDVNIGFYYFGVLGMMMRFQAEKYRLNKKAKEDGWDWLTSQVASLGALTHQFQSGVFEGTSPIINFMQKDFNKPDAANRLMANWADLGTNFAFPKVLQQSTPLFDKTKRDASFKHHNLKDAIKSKLARKTPFLSKDLTPQRDMAGREVSSVPRGENAFLYSYFNVLDARKATNLPFDPEMFRLYERTEKATAFPDAIDPKVTSSDPTIGDIPLTEKQYDRYWQIYGKYLQEYVPIAIENGMNESDEIKLLELQAAYKSAKAEAQEELKAELGID